jgi:DNA polymerase I-like protein with 3'-5' exonuclease and polymerase domains
MNADLIIGHNVIRFDIPLIKKLYPWFEIQEDRVRDTLVCTRLLWPDIAERDLAKGRALGKLTGSHSLEAWGKRLGNYKGDFKGPWDTWTPVMQEYCEQDVAVTYDLWMKIQANDHSEAAIDLEHKVAWIIAQQERNGFLFDTVKAQKLYATLVGKRVELESKLQATFAPWWSCGDIKTPTKTISYKDPLKADRTAGATFTEVTLNLFNPGSRHHIADRLSKLRGWKPKEFTEKGQPKVDESVLEKLKYPEAQLLAEYFMLDKRIGQIAEGDQAWLKQVKADGRIHGSVNTNGAVTGRATHSHPNIAQVPAVGIQYGAECREMFCVPPGKKLVGIDVSGLELRMLGHYMAKYDDGAYAKEVIDGDIHTANQQAAGLSSRNDAKRFIYAFLYGAGPAKIALVTGRKTRAEGAAIKDQFLAKTPALKSLIEAVQSAAERRKYLVGLDGRRLHIRSAHAALNTLLQSAGALVCKRWLVELHQMLKDAGLLDSVRQVAWIHDEVQLEVDEDLAEIIGKLAVDAIKKAGLFFAIRVPLDGEYKIGNNWAECH